MRIEMPDRGKRSSTRLAHGCFLLGGLLILFQLVMIVHARFSDARYFSWAVHDVVWSFKIHVTIDAQELSDSQVRARYRIKRPSYHEHAIEHVIRAIRQYEETHGRDDDAKVLLIFSRNGRAEQRWLWPEP